MISRVARNAGQRPQSIVVTNEDTKFKSGRCGELADGTLVRVKGRRAVTGIVTAREVEQR